MNGNAWNPLHSLTQMKTKMCHFFWKACRKQIFVSTWYHIWTLLRHHWKPNSIFIFFWKHSGASEVSNVLILYSKFNSYSGTWGSILYNSVWWCISLPAAQFLFFTICSSFLFPLPKIDRTQWAKLSCSITQPYWEDYVHNTLT